MHSVLKCKLDAAAPTLLTDAWRHCQLDFHYVDGDALSSLTAGATAILTAVQSEGKLYAQTDKCKTDKASTSNTETNTKKRDTDGGAVGSPVARKDEEGHMPADVAKFVTQNKICMRCTQPLCSVPIHVHHKSSACIDNRPSQEEAEKKLRDVMSKAGAASESGAKPSKGKHNKK